MVEYEVDGHKDRHGRILARLPHRLVHHFIPAFLCEDLEHGHGGLYVGGESNANTYRNTSCKGQCEGQIQTFEIVVKQF